MRISQAAEVIGEPLSTLKDLRHRSILEMADGGWGEERDEEIRTWGSFSVPSVMVLAGASQLRRTYSLSWPNAVEFTKTALGTISVQVEGFSPTAKFFDLNVVPEEIWVGRCDFLPKDEIMPGHWNYFFGSISSISVEILEVMKRREHAVNRAKLDHFSLVLPQTGSPHMCLLLNASRLCRETWEKVRRVRGEVRAD